MAYARQVRIVIVITIMIVVGGRVGPSDRVLRLLGGWGGGRAFVIRFRVSGGSGGPGGSAHQPCSPTVASIDCSTSWATASNAGWVGGWRRITNSPHLTFVSLSVCLVDLSHFSRIHM